MNIIAMLGCLVWLFSFPILKFVNADFSTRFSLSATTLKFIGIVSMTIDHIGYFLFPRIVAFRVIGRIAYPIFAYFIAEGCTYTRHKMRYFFSVFSIGVLYSVGAYLVNGSLRQSVLITFSCSIALIFLLAQFRVSDKKHLVAKLSWLFSFFILFILCFLLFQVHIISRFKTDYGFWGIITPVLVWSGCGKIQKLMGLSIGLVIICKVMVNIQLFSLLSLLLLAMYNGERGRKSWKPLFYIYYPAHIAVLYCISVLIDNGRSSL